MSVTSCRFRPALRAITCIDNSTTARSICVPVFLAPAFAGRHGDGKSFSTSRPARSRIGRLGLSTPPDVTFTFTQPPPMPKNVLRPKPEQVAGSVVVEGPMGKLKLQTPPFLSIQSDAANRAHTLVIQDETDKHQRAMWGSL